MVTTVTPVPMVTVVPVAVVTAVPLAVITAPPMTARRWGAWVDSSCTPSCS